MGHDLDQVIRAAPGALATLRQQRDNLDHQIQALEALLKTHNALVLQYTVDEKGLVDDVAPIEPGPPVVAHIEVKKYKRDQILEVMREMREPMRAEDISQFVEMDPKSIRATLTQLRKQGKIDRVERGAYQAVVNG